LHNPLQRLVQIFLGYLYTQVAWLYDTVASLVSLGMWQDWVACTLPFLDGPVTLELGHGPGHLQNLLQEKGNIYFGIDLSRQMGLLARKNNMAAITPMLTNGDVHHLPYKCHTFHEIVSTFPTNFITEDKVLREIQRVLIPGGKLIIVPMAWIKSTKTIYRLAAWLFSITGEAPEHAQKIVTKYFTEILTEVGFICQPHMIELQNSLVLLFLCCTTPEDNLG
jgi:ubiquinone/menaquinone biosynthesis C-methylase UbiE